MTVEIGTEAALLPENEYINGIFVAEWATETLEKGGRGRGGGSDSCECYDRLRHSQSDLWSVSPSNDWHSFNRLSPSLLPANLGVGEMMKKYKSIKRPVARDVYFFRPYKIKLAFQEIQYLRRNSEKEPLLLDE